MTNLTTKSLSMLKTHDQQRLITIYNSGQGTVLPDQYSANDPSSTAVLST